MYVTITPDALRTARDAAKDGAPRRYSTAPVLSTLRLTASTSGTLAFEATNLDVFIRTQAPADVSAGGAVCVDAQLLAQIASRAAPQPIVLRLEDDRLHVSAGAQYDLPTVPATEWPDVPRVEWGGALPEGALAEIARRCAPAVSTEQSRPILNGVMVRAADGMLTAVGTDGHRLVRWRTPYDGELPEMIVHPSALRIAARLGGEVEVGRSDSISGAATSWIGFRSGGTTVIARLMHGPYPNYEQVIPQDLPLTAVVEAAHVLENIARVALVAPENTGRTVWEWDRGTLTISAASADLGKGSVTIPADYEGEEFKIGLNHRYVTELLRAVGSERVRFAMSGPERAVVLTPEGTAADMLALVMPLRLLEE